MTDGVARQSDLASEQGRLIPGWADRMPPDAFGGTGADGAVRIVENSGQVSVGLVHDMGNLLQIVSSALSLVERSVEKGDLAQAEILYRRAREALSRIAVLRSQILASARIEQPVVEPIDPGYILASLRGLREMTSGPRIFLNIECAAKLPNVYCDAQELENAILNLVVNARDAMPLGGRLNIALGSDMEPWPDGVILRSDCPHLILQISDTGCGISESIIGRVFEPFFSTKPAGRGTGLGLPMVAEFVRRAGGAIAIKSDTGRGTTVSLHLPGVDVDPDRARRLSAVSAWRQASTVALR